MEFQVGISAVFCHLSVTDGFGWFGMGNFCKSISLMLVSLKAPYTLIIFLMMLFVTLLSMLTISLTVLIVIWLLIRASDMCQLLQLASKLESDLNDNLVLSRKWLVNFDAKKTLPYWIAAVKVSLLLNLPPRILDSFFCGYLLSL